MSIPDLIQRLETAGEGSPELDGRIWCALNGKRFTEAWDNEYGLGCSYTSPPRRTRETVKKGQHLERFTRSVDAALALIDRSLPNEKLFLQMAGERRGQWMATFDGFDSVFAPTPALSLCLAILRAIESQSQP